MRSIYITLTGFLLFSSCISQQALDREILQRQDWEDRAVALANELNALEDETRSLADRYTACQQRQERWQNDSLRVVELEKQLANSRKALAVQTSHPEPPATNTSTDLMNHWQDLAAQSAGQDEILKKVYQSLYKDLATYPDNHLMVQKETQSVHIILTDALLFKQTSIRPTEQGMRAVKKIIPILKKYDQLEIRVEGHTDDVPIRRNQIRGNWDLSVLRASTIARSLQRDFGIDPKRLMAAGRGAFAPRQSNDNERGRAANRRTEIILFFPPLEMSWAGE